MNEGVKAFFLGVGIDATTISDTTLAPIVEMHDELIHGQVSRHNPDVLIAWPRMWSDSKDTILTQHRGNDGPQVLHLFRGPDRLGNHARSTRLDVMEGSELAMQNELSACDLISNDLLAIVMLPDVITESMKVGMLGDLSHIIHLEMSQPIHVGRCHMLVK